MRVEEILHAFLAEERLDGEFRGFYIGSAKMVKTLSLPLSQIRRSRTVIGFTNHIARRIFNTNLHDILVLLLGLHSNMSLKI